MQIDYIINKNPAFKLALQINKVPQEVRSLVTLVSVSIFAVSLISLFIVSLLFSYPALMSSVFAKDEAQSFLLVIVNNLDAIRLLFFISMSVSMLGICLNSFYNYYYLRSVRRIFEKNVNDITYELIEVYSKNTPTFEDLIIHRESDFLISRLGIDRDYLRTRFGGSVLPYTIPVESSNEPVTLGAVWRAVYDSDEELARYLLSQSIKKKTVYRVTRWMDRLIEDKKRKSAWWWRENLSKIRGFAKTLSYGTTAYMSHYATEMVFDQKLFELGDTILHQDECDRLEEFLSRSSGANAVIVGPNGSGRYTIALALARAIDEGRVYSEIEYKRMFLLHPESFEFINEKESLENTFVTIFNEAVTARNIIFVINDITKFVTICNNLGFDFWSLVNPYIEHNTVSLVVLANEETSSKEEYKKIFDAKFGVITMRDLNDDLLLPYLEDKALAEEKITGKFFIYNALEVVAQALPVFFVEDAPLVKANTLLQSLATSISSKRVITDSDVSGYLQSSSGIAIGKINEEEKEMLLTLEETLAKNVIGQREAVVTVAKTMRRIRSGITDRLKPMGTFLFFGPTGSGKTETAKTLAKAFFGSEEHMSRIDMGEYAVLGSVRRLIGDRDFEGDLAKLVHSRPYGVLLLDEFEKSENDVKDLFLRILDEGVFTNGEGHVISLRTQIIIATSNAGSEFIKETIDEGDYDEVKADETKNRVIDFVLEQGIFKPELVNRFDGTVMFSSLSQDVMKGVAKKILNKLGVRMEEKGYKVEWSDDIVEYVTEHSQASEFGGRAIQRVIQDTVEDVLSKKIIKGDIIEGDAITISKADIVNG